MLIKIRTALLLALLWIFTGMLSFAVAGEPLVSHQVVTDVTPRSFSVVWISSEPSICSLRVFDDQYQELSGLTLVSESALHPPAEDLGVMKVKVTDLQPNTTYYFQTLTTSKGDGRLTISPLEPTRVQTELNSIVVYNDVLAHRIFQRDGETAAEGALLLAEVDSGNYPITGWVEIGDFAPWAFVNLDNIYNRETHANLELAGGEGLTLTSIGGSLGFKLISVAIPPETGTIQTLQPLPSEEQSTLSTDADNDEMFDDFEVTYGLDPLDASDALLDPDNDGQSNLHEHQLGTNPRAADSDGDGCDDGVEVLGGRNPTILDPQGDLNADCALNLQDAIIALQVQSAVPPSDTIDISADVDADGKIGMEVVVYVLQKMAGIR